MMNFCFRELAWKIVLFLLVFPVALQAQVPVPGPRPPPVWVAGTQTANDLFPTPDEACRRKHQYFNPNADYQPPVYGSHDVYYCRWTLNANSNTILPSLVFITCPDGLGAREPGVCVRNEIDDEPGCGGGCGGGGGGGGGAGGNGSPGMGGMRGGGLGGGSRTGSAPPQPRVGNPADLNYAAKVEEQTDYETSDGLFVVHRSYRSRPRNQMAVVGFSEIPGFGKHWHGVLPGIIVAYGMNYSHFQYHSTDGDIAHFRVVDEWNPNDWVLNGVQSDKRRLSMVTVPQIGKNVYFGAAGTAVVNGPGELRMDTGEGEYILFRRSGFVPVEGRRYLIPIEQGFASGYKVFFDYPDSDHFPNKVRDSFGREMQLTWASAPLNNGVVYEGEPPNKVLTDIALPDGTKLKYTYGHGASGTNLGRKDRLESVQRLTSTNTVLWGRSFLYEDAAFPYALTGQVDQNGQRLSTYAYDQAGLLTLTEQAGGVNRYTIVNMHEWPPTSSYYWRYRYVTNPLGRREDYAFRVYRFAFGRSPQILDSITGYATANVPADVRSFTYDGYIEDWRTTSMTDANGRTMSIVNHPTTLQPTATIEANGTPSARQTSITWHTQFNLPVREEKDGLRVDYGYGPTGQLLTRTETDTTSHTLPYATAGQSRTWTYDWASTGRLLSINGPKPVDAQGKDDKTIFAYDPAGNLLTSTNGLGHVTSFSGYDANGRPAQMTDANGIVTAFTYDQLGRTKTVTIKDPVLAANDSVTTIDYDVEGRVAGITLPSTDKLFVDYNLAGQLIAIRASSGERIDYVNNAMGGVTSETFKRANGTAARQITRTFDELNRMLTETLGPGRTTGWTYDKEGNATQIVSPRNQATQFAFDPLNRLVSTLAPDTGTTATAYNALDDAVSHTDAASVQTSFVRNGFGDVIQETSPDRGTSIFYYNAAGEMTASIDGRGQRIDYARDILGRVLSKTPVGRPASEVVSYVWDSAGIAGSYGVGRLASVTDNGTSVTRFKYDHRGNVLTKQQTIGSTAAANLSYTYDLADRITQITYPSGRLVGYVRDSKGRVTTVRTKATAATANWTNIATAIAYEPWGSLTSATLGNTLSMTNNWGNDGRLASRRLYVTSSGVNRSLLSYAYDNDDNITGITDGVTASNSVTHVYDVVGRLTRTVSQAGTYRREDYLHDANGNRTAVERRVNAADANPAQTDTYTRTAGSNRLAGVTLPAGPRSIVYDGRGNTLSETRPASVAVSVSYDGHGRLVGYVRTGDATQANVYNGLDERVRVTSGTTVRRFVYDPDGRVMGEYGTSAANVIAERIWLQPEVEEPNLPFGGDDGTNGYAPIALVAGTTLRWVHGNHLGVPQVYTGNTGAAIATPAYTLPGFPGQFRTYADLWYNKYRDYDSTTGRYIQADPIGLDGGDNLYLYALGNPVRYTDPTGQFVPAAILGGIAFGVVTELAIQAAHNYFTGAPVLDPRCYEWGEVAFAGGLGALGGNWARSWVKVTEGSMKWNNVSRRIRRAEDLVRKPIDLHHSLIPQRFAGGTGGVRDRIVNHPFNLRPMERNVHREVHQIGGLEGYWRGLPGSVKGGVIYGAGGLIFEGVDGSFDE